MARPKDLLENNRRWAANMTERDALFFERLKAQQAPKYLWIGCSDSRVPATEICGLLPGEMFVHRNVANLVGHTDVSCLSVLQFAVEALGVEDIIVCGHYGCGGVRAAMGNSSLGLIDHWLFAIKDIYQHNKAELEALPEGETRLARLCELNVAAQVQNLCRTATVQAAWRAGRELSVHGWIYGVHNGLINDLGVSVTREAQIPRIYRVSVPPPPPREQ
jgi:carbonic anhydrase